MPELGISIRLIRQYDPKAEQRPGRSLQDVALQVALCDDRDDVPMQQKVADAWAFVKSRVN